jgi:hypothetical protein
VLSITVELNLGTAKEPVPAAVAVHSERPSEVTTTIMDPLFTAARKAPHLNVIIVKQEASWFQLWEEKRQKTIAEKLAL